MSRPDFEESRHWPAESCTELGADEIGCGPQGSGLNPVEWLLLGLLVLVVLMLIAFLVAGHV